MIKPGHPGGCCCPDASPPRMFFNSGSECCMTPECTATVTNPAGGATVGSCTIPDSTVGGGCSFTVSSPAPGTVLDWTITCPGRPTKSGTITVPAAGMIAYATAYWTIPELVPLTLSATVTGDEAIIGGGGTWSGTLTCDGVGVVTSEGTTYTWDSGCLAGLGHWSTYIQTWCYSYNPDDGTCADLSLTPYGEGVGHPPSVIGGLKVLATFDYVSTRCRLTLLVPPPDAPPGSHCTLHFGWRNFDVADCPGTDPASGIAWKNDTTCPCGVLTFEEGGSGFGWAARTRDPYPKPADWIDPACFYPSFVYPSGWDMTGADGDLAIACSPPDWTGTAAAYSCVDGGTVTITA